MIYVGENEITNIMIGENEIYGIYAGELQIYPTDFGTVTGITIENLVWVTDIPYSGGTATADNCSFKVYANYDSGKKRNVTTKSTVSGSLVVPATTAETREMVGTLTLTADYEGITNSATVDVYQKKYSIVNYIPTLTFVSNSWIDTKLNATLETRTEMYDIYYPQYSTYQVFFGANNSDTDYNWYRVRIEYPINTINGAIGRRFSMNFTYPLEGNLYFDKEALVYEHKDSTIQSVAMDATRTNPIKPTIFIGAAQNLDGSAGNIIHNLTVGEVKFFESGVLVGDFKPALDEDDVACFYDEVTGKYFYNSGSGTIIGNTN